MGKSNKIKMHKPAKIESQYSGMRGSWTEKEYSRGVDYEDSTALQQRSDDLCEQNADRFSEAARWPELTRANLRPKIKNNVARKVSFARPRGGCSYSSKLRTAVEENEKRPPVVNFPLPAEIREHIYSYLLNADEVESPPETHSCLLDRSRCQAGTCSLPTFLFQKQMFRVNKTIGSEALHYFRRENKIVQFQFKNHDLFRHCVTFDVPVFYSQMPRSQSHMFTINVDWNRGRREYYLPVDALRNGIVFEASREKLQNNRPFLVLGKHLPKVLPLLRHYCERELPQGYLITSHAGSPVSLRFNNADHAPRLQLQLCTKNFVPAGKDKRDHLMKLVHGVLRFPADVATRGIVHGDGGKWSLFQRPQLVWEQAVHWDRLETFSHLKRIADDHMVASRHQIAWQGYSTILNWMHATFDEDVKAQVLGNPAHHPALKRLAHLMWDIVVSTVHLLLSQGRHKEADKIILLDRLSPLIHAAGLTPRMFDQYMHFNALIDMMWYSTTTREVTLVDIITRFQAHVAVLKSITPQTKQISNDIAVLEGLVLMTSKADMRSLQVLRQELSVGKFAFQPYDSQPDLSLPSRPEGLERFQDKRHHAMLSEEDKKQIRSLDGLELRPHAIEGESLWLNGLKICG